MRAVAATSAALVVAAAFAVFPALARAGADLAVTQTAYQGETLDSDVPEHTGPLLITPDPEMMNGEPDTTNYVTFRSLVTNSGPDDAYVTFSWHVSGLDDQPGYNYWTGPAQNTMSSASGEDANGETCDIDFVDVLRCRFDLPVGSTFELGFAVRGNAPGTFSIYSKVDSNRSDPNTANNKSAVFSEPVVCSINGTSENDKLTGTSDFDSICGRGGDDRITAIGTADKVFGGSGDDLFVGQPKSQQFLGGAGEDTISYADAPRALRLSLTDRGAIGWGYDTILGVENVIGTRYDDYIEGSGAANKIVGRGGDDQLYGRGNSDLLAGGRGSDDFLSRDDVSDAVYGGKGLDGAYRDALDVVRSSFSSAVAAFADEDIPPPSGGG